MAQADVGAGPQRPPPPPGDRAREGAATLTPVRAAGGVVWRRGGGGAVEILLVHRPRYDDWSLPKGKLDPGEDDETAARREVEEETGLRCVLGEELVGSSYVDHMGRPKVVRYWAMTVEGGAFTGEHEVDEVRWVALDEADAFLSYPRDRVVLDSFRVLARTL